MREPAAGVLLPIYSRRPAQANNNIMMLIIKMLCLFLSGDKAFRSLFSLYKDER